MLTDNKQLNYYDLDKRKLIMSFSLEPYFEDRFVFRTAEFFTDHYKDIV